MNRDDQFQDWRRRADECDLLETAQRYGATMKRSGREYKGPCPFDGGRDRFSLSTISHKWYCRGGQCGGRGAISMVQHIGGLTFLQSCEALTGEPNPNTNRPSKPLSAEEQAARNRQRQENDARQRARQVQETQYQEDTKGAAARIWGAAISIYGTLAEKYLTSRGILPDVSGPLRFHPTLPYPGKSGTYPALICCVDDMGGDLCAVWRIFLRADGRKMDVANPKLGLGPAGGGAVRIGGVGPKIGLAEGLESALGAWNLIGRKYPVWAALSTSGLIGIELPLGVEHVVLFPDGDSPVRKKGHDFEPAVPAGRKAAEALRTRLLAEGVACTIASEPGPGKDYCDLWNESQRETA